MQINELSSNDFIVAEIGRRLKEARIASNLTQKQLSERSGVSLRTVANIESGHDVSTKSLISIIRALGFTSRLDILIPEQEIQPIELLKAKPKRKRVRHSAKSKSATSSWKWGDEK